MADLPQGPRAEGSGRIMAAQRSILASQHRIMEEQRRAAGPPQEHKNVTALEHALFVVVADCVRKSVQHPFEVAKTRQQIDPQLSGRGLFQTFCHIWREGKMCALFPGLGFGLIRYYPETLINAALSVSVRSTFHSLANAAGLHPNTSAPWKLFVFSLIAETFAKIPDNLVRMPLYLLDMEMVVEWRAAAGESMQKEGADGANRTDVNRAGLAAARVSRFCAALRTRNWKEIVAVLGRYVSRALSPRRVAHQVMLSLGGLVVFRAAQALCQNVAGALVQVTGLGASSAIVGALSIACSTASTLASYPVDTVRRRMLYYDESVNEAVKAVRKSEGGFWAGADTTVCMGVVSAAALMVVAEFRMSWLRFRLL